jgi:hypothetical protein
MWEEDKIAIEEKYYELLNSSNILLFDIAKEHYERVKPIFPIVLFILQRIESVVELTCSFRIWDAEIILRSVMETFVKLMYISTASEDAQTQLLDEFWNGLSEINAIKMSEQAKRNLEIFKNSEPHRIAWSPLVLSDEREAELREKWPKKKRLEVEKRWSFTEITNYISAKYQGVPWGNLTAMGYGYRMCSHVTHGDETGILIIEERNSRPDEERDKAYRGHYLRLFSDCLTFTINTAVMTMLFLGLEKEITSFVGIMKKIDSISDLEAKYKGKVFEGVYYDKYRSY